VEFDEETLLWSHLECMLTLKVQGGKNALVYKLTRDSTYQVQVREAYYLYYEL